MDNPGGGGFGAEQGREIAREASPILPEALPPSFEKPAAEDAITPDQSLIGQDADAEKLPGPLPADSETSPITESPPTEQTATPAAPDLSTENLTSLEDTVNNQIIDVNNQGVQ